MNKLEQIYEGKAKKVFKTDDPELLIVDYKDDATAFNGEKKGQIAGKGVINNRMSNLLMKMLEGKGVPTHFVEEISERETIVKAVTIMPLEVIVRNISAGSFAKRYGVEEGIVFEAPTFEVSYKNDDLGDPLMCESHAIALGIVTEEEINTIRQYALKVNEELKAFFLERGLKLVDFKIEFGKTSDGTIVGMASFVSSRSRALRATSCTKAMKSARLCASATRRRDRCRSAGACCSCPTPT